MSPRDPKAMGDPREIQIGQRGTETRPNKHENVQKGGPFSCRAGLRHKAVASSPLTLHKRPTPPFHRLNGFRGCPLILPVQLPKP
jgi:hypothetical protein